MHKHRQQPDLYLKELTTLQCSILNACVYVYIRMTNEYARMIRTRLAWFRTQTTFAPFLTDYADCVILYRDTQTVRNDFQPSNFGGLGSIFSALLLSFLEVIFTCIMTLPSTCCMTAVECSSSRVYFNCTTYIHVYIIWYEIHRN